MENKAKIKEKLFLSKLTAVNIRLVILNIIVLTTPE